MNYSSNWELFIRLLAPCPGDRILDVGAGKGKVAKRVLAGTAGTEMYALEPDKKRVAYIKKESPEVKSYVGRSEEIPFGDSFFDKVYTTIAMHHFTDLDLALGEFARVLKEGGRLLILDVDPSKGAGRLMRFFENTIMRRPSRFLKPDQMIDRLRATRRFEISESIDGAPGYLILCVMKTAEV